MHINDFFLHIVFIYCLTLQVFIIFWNSVAIDWKLRWSIAKGSSGTAGVERLKFATFVQSNGSVFFCQALLKKLVLSTQAPSLGNRLIFKILDPVDCTNFWVPEILDVEEAYN